MKSLALLCLAVARIVLLFGCLSGTNAFASFSATPDPTVCTVAPCFTYRYNALLWSNVTISTGEKPSREAACAAVPAMLTLSFSSNPNTPGWTESNARLVGNDCWSDTYDKQGASLGTHNRGPGIKTAVAPSAPVYSCPDPASATLSGSTCTCKPSYLQNTYTNGCTAGGEGGTTVDILHVTKASSCPWCEGNPIYPLVGGKVEPVATGMNVGGQPLVFTYSSAKQVAAVAAGKTAKTFGNMPALGGLWESSLHRNLSFGTGGHGATLYRGNGQTVSFRYSGSTYIADADVNGTFTVISGGYRYVDAKSRTIETYNTAGQLISLADAAGNTLTFSYSTATGAIAPAAGYLQKITDQNGRSLSFVYTLPTGGVAATDGLISGVSDSMGRTMSAGFATNGNLTQLTWPDAKTRQFVYENASLPWALTGVIDERGIRYSTFTYDSAGRALSTEHAGGVNKFSVSYSTPPQVAVTQTYDPATQLTTRTHDWQAPAGVQLTRPNGETANASNSVVLGYPLPTGFSQPAGSGYGAANNASTFDANGNLTSTDDFSGQRSCYAYDSSNRETVRVEGLATTVACASVLPGGSTLPTGSRKTETTWHPDWRLSTRVSQPLLNTSAVYHGQPDPFNSNVVANCTTAPALPNGKPVPLVCKQVEQITLSSGAIDPAVAARTTAFTYDAAGRVLSSTDANNRSTSYAYYPGTSFTTNGDPNFDKVSLLLHGDGANGSTAITDSSLLSKPVTVVGGASIASAQSKFGGSSLYFDGVRDYVSVPSHPSLSMGAADFTIEMWLYKLGSNANYSRLWNPDGDYNADLFLGLDPSGNLVSYGSSTGTSWNSWAFATGIPVPTGVWKHMALTRFGGTVTLYLDGIGTVMTTSLNTTALYDGNYTHAIGGQGPGLDRTLNGYIDELRVTKGVARYTANFTPPAQAFPSTGPVIDPNALGHTAGDLQSITNAAGHVTQFTQYDGLGRVRQMVDPKGVVTDTVYTPRGWISSVTVTPSGGTARTTSYAYDNAGQLTGVTLPDATTMSYSYDAAHRLTGVTDAKGNSVTYTLDNTGNKTGEQVKDPSGTLQRNITRVYDALNRVQQITGASN